MITSNKGEWSELYAFLRLLADGKVYAANESLNKMDKIHLPILSIIREETLGQRITYDIHSDVSISINQKEIMSIDRETFDREAKRLLAVINDSKSRGSFAIPETEAFMNKILASKISAPASTKSDITMNIIDINTGFSPIVGFSIKSELGAAPTLLNAGRTTNFIFRLDHFQALILDDSTGEYQAKNDARFMRVKERISTIAKAGGKFTFSHMHNKVFRDNLMLIDSKMVDIIAETLLYYYRDGITNCFDLVEELKRQDPMQYHNDYAYAYKFKKFLTAIALGMRPATVWNGIDEASGGYLVVKPNGDVLAYHIYNRDCFEEYLLKNTKYETASTSRHGFGDIYTVDGQAYINLNLQIRFL